MMVVDVANNKNALIIFVRKPELGKVKTRLATSIGEKQTLVIYKNLLQHTFNISKLVAADKYIFYTNEIEESDIWTLENYYKRVQINGGLGEKMLAAFEEVFKSGYKNVTIIGSDCFELTTSIIEDGFKELEYNDVVVGPAKDGGYYLLGMKASHSVLFENKQWSTNMVYSSTIKDLETNKLTFSILPLLTDVDTVEDLPEEIKNTIS